eukprot:gene3321-13351_t
MPQEVAAQAGAAQGDNRQGNGQGSIFFTIARIGFMWWVMQYFGKKKESVPAADIAPNQHSFPSFPKYSLIDLYCYASEKSNIRRYGDENLVWSVKAMELAGPSSINTTWEYNPSEAVQNNASLYLHVIFAKSGIPIDPVDPNYDESMVFGRVHNLIVYHKKPKNDTTVNLLSGNALPQKQTAEELQVIDNARPIISFFKPNLTIQVVDSFATYPKNAIPPQVGPYMQFDEGGNYFPIIYFNEFWLLRDKLIKMNETVKNVTLTLEFSTQSMWWWQLMTQMEKSFEMQTGMGMTQDGESDELKRVLLEGNPYLLALTFIVSMLHTVFDVLAFKNDIGFWKENKSMEGLSARSVLINAFCQLIILFYLFDNETSMVILFSSVVGTAIEFWKVTKAMEVKLLDHFPFISFKDRASYSTTKQHDADAMRYLSYVLYPLVAGYAVYALMYQTHKSWWSWLINSLVGAVYMFGFILMCPQLYLNYKLKSVAHLPWRQMSYKFLNTIIDDLFAFVIKMPLLHRISVFRDDVIFCIFLYQRWIYRVDTSRVNEFGYAGPAEGKTEAIEGEGAEEEEEEVKLLGEGEKSEPDGSEPALARKRAGKGTAGVVKEVVVATEVVKKKEKKKSKVEFTQQLSFLVQALFLQLPWARFILGSRGGALPFLLECSVLARFNDDDAKAKGLAALKASSTHRASHRLAWQQAQLETCHFPTCALGLSLRLKGDDAETKGLAALKAGSTHRASHRPAW